MPNRVLRFGGYRLDPAAGRLWRGDDPLHLTPKAFELLRVLAERQGQMVTKEALFLAVWPGTTVSDDALTRCVREVRTALGDPAREPEFIETVHRRGFRFLPPVIAGGHGPTDPFPFVGRDAALARVRAAFEESVAGRAQLLFVCGEPGAGKTRFAEEICDHARSAGALALWGRAHEGEGRPPYWIWKPILEACAGAVGVDESSGSLLERTQARFQAFDAVGRALARAAARQPLCIVLDDLHAADVDSLRLLAFLAQELGESRVLLLGTYRDVGTPENPALIEALAQLIPAHADPALIELRGLEREDVRRLLAALSNDELAERLTGPVHEKTGGNPFYLNELARLLTDRASEEAPETWRIATPETTRQVLRRRLGGLSVGCRDALVLASVAGQEFSPALLERAAESGADAFADGLHEARAQRLVVVESRDSARFVHDLVREIVYEDLRPGVRARLHRRIALAIEATSAAQPEPPLSALAHHFGRAVLGGDLAVAIRYAGLAGDRALEGLAFEEGAEHYDSALGLLESTLPLDVRAQCRAELSAARAHFLCGRAARARALAASALARARGADDPELLYLASATFCELEPSFPRDAGRFGVIDDALARLGNDAHAPRAHLLGLRGMLSFSAADPDDHLKCGREAVELARRSGDRRVLLDSLRCLCFALLHPGDEPEWCERYEEMIAVAVAEGSSRHELDARLFRFEHRQRSGSSEAIERELDELDALAERIGTHSARAAVLRARAGRAIAAGRLDEARRCAEQALAVGRTVDAPFAQVVSLLQLGSLRYVEGSHGEALPEVRIGADLNPEIAMLQAGVIWMLWESGARDEARRCLEALAERDFADLARDASRPMALANLALSCGHLGVTAGAERLLELLAPYAGRTLTLLHYFSGGCASRELGVLAGLLERWNDAAQHFETAMAVDRSRGERASEVHALMDYARMLLARGNASSRARAKRLFAAAAESARELGMRAIEQEIAALTR